MEDFHLSNSVLQRSICFLSSKLLDICMYMKAKISATEIKFEAVGSKIMFKASGRVRMKRKKPRRQPCGHRL